MSQSCFFARGRVSVEPRPKSCSERVEMHFACTATRAWRCFRRCGGSEGVTHRLEEDLGAAPANGCLLAGIDEPRADAPAPLPIHNGQIADIGRPSPLLPSKHVDRSFALGLHGNLWHQVCQRSRIMTSSCRGSFRAAVLQRCSSQMGLRAPDTKDLVDSW